MLSACFICIFPNKKLVSKFVFMRYQIGKIHVDHALGEGKLELLS